MMEGYPEKPRHSTGLAQAILELYRELEEAHRFYVVTHNKREAKAVKRAAQSLAAAVTTLDEFVWYD